VRLIGLICCCALIAFAAPAQAEGRVVIIPAIEPPSQTATFPENLQPGRNEPAKPAVAAAYRLHWDNYESLLVVGEGTGSVRPAWVVTYDNAGTVAVAYRGKAYLDKQGNLHVDARQALLSGPQAHNWSADSFALTQDKQVYTLDDSERGNSGTVTERIDPDQNKVFDRLMDIAQAIVNDNT
jgi:hypothetical protein